MRNRVSQLIRTPAVWVSLAGSAAVAIAVLTCVSGCGHSTAQSEPVSLEPQSIAVATTTPKLETMRRTIVQPGWISSYEHTPIYAKIAGFVQFPDEKVDIGYHMKKDQLLCTLWVPEIEADVEVKKSQVAQARTDLELAGALLAVAKANVTTWKTAVDVAEKALVRAEAEYKRWEFEYQADYYQHYTLKVLDKANLDEAENQMNAAKATEGEAKAKLGAAKASLRESDANRLKAEANVKVKQAKVEVCDHDWKLEKAWLDYASIIAPYDGIITQRFVHEGHFVQPASSGSTSKHAEPMFMFMQTNLMRVVIQVPEYDAPLIRDKDEAVVTVQALKDDKFTGTVKRSSWMLDGQSRTLRVEVQLENPKEILRAGMYASVSIMADLNGIMTLPVDAVLIDQDKNYIYVVEDGKARRLNVKVGVQNKSMIQLISKEVPGKDKDDPPQWVNFTGDERVILTSLDNLHDGQPVTLK